MDHSGADPLRLAVVFGIEHSTAMTYADLTRQILTETEPTASTRPDDRFGRRFAAADLQSR